MAPAEKSTVATPASPTTKSATTAPSSPSQAPASASSAAKTASQGQDKVNTSSEAKPSSSTAAAHLAVLNVSSTAATSSATGATTATGAVGVTDPSAIGILPASHWDGPVNDVSLLFTYTCLMSLLSMPVGPMCRFHVPCTLRMPPGGSFPDYSITHPALDLIVAMSQVNPYYQCAQSMALFVSLCLSLSLYGVETEVDQLVLTQSAYL